jgi:tetratricopeptide (TPR) repeat protein
MEGAHRTLLNLETHCAKLGMEIGAVFVPLSKGWVALCEHHWDEALREYARGIDEMTRHEDSEELKDAQIEMAEAYLGAGMVVQARQTFSLVSSGGEVMAGLIPKFTMAEGWLWAMEGRPKEARECFEKAVTEAHTAGNVFNEGLAKNFLWRWEESYGDPEKASILHGEAKALFDTSGVLPEGWAREWPPVFAVGAPAPP